MLVPIILKYMRLDEEEINCLPQSLERNSFLAIQLASGCRGHCIVNAYCQFSQQACTNFIQTYWYLLISTHFFILTTNLHCKISQIQIHLAVKTYFTKNEILFSYETVAVLKCMNKMCPKLNNRFLKFIYSENATKFCEISTHRTNLR